MEWVLFAGIVMAGFGYITRQITRAEVRKQELANERRRDELASGVHGTITKEAMVEGVQKAITSEMSYARYR